jgi:hypothetical protein
MSNKTLSVIAAAALSIGLGFAATSGATAAPALGAMQAAKADVKMNNVVRVSHRRHVRSYRTCVKTYRWGTRLVRTYYGWRYVPYRYFVGYRCNYGYGY